MTERKNLQKVRVPSFGSIQAAREALRRKDAHLPADLYPRDGSFALLDLEKKVAGLVGVNPDNLLLYGTGMSALVDVLEVNNPTKGNTILHGEQLYSKAYKYLRTTLSSRGVRVADADSGSLSDIDNRLKSLKPDVVLFETVSNGINTPVLDIEGLFALNSVKELNPLIILDHTLSTSALYPTARILEARPEKTVVLESGTKFYGLNWEMAGIASTYDDELIASLKDRRQMVGSLLSASATEAISEILPSKEQFDYRNRIVAENTFRLALACAEGLEGNDTYIVSHPALKGHPNAVYTRTHYLNGGSPVFFLSVKYPVLDETDTRHFALTDMLDSDPVIHQAVEMRQSFGFNETTMWPDSQNPSLRIAGGTETTQQRLVLEKAFKKVLATIDN